VFKSFYEKGFALPAGAFFRGLLHFYGLEVTHLMPNSITQIAIFIHLCEGYLGIVPYFNLWRALYRLKGHPSNVHRNIVRGAAFARRASTPTSSSATPTKGGHGNGLLWRTRCPAS